MRSPSLDGSIGDCLDNAMVEASGINETTAFKVKAFEPNRWLLVGEAHRPSIGPDGIVMELAEHAIPVVRAVMSNGSAAAAAAAAAEPGIGGLVRLPHDPNLRMPAVAHHHRSAR
jgi:hypothetical protein